MNSLVYNIIIFEECETFSIFYSLEVVILIYLVNSQSTATNKSIFDSVSACTSGHPPLSLNTCWTLLNHPLGISRARKEEAKLVTTVAEKVGKQHMEEIGRERVETGLIRLRQMLDQVGAAKAKSVRPNAKKKKKKGTGETWIPAEGTVNKALSKTPQKRLVNEQIIWTDSQLTAHDASLAANRNLEEYTLQVRGILQQFCTTDPFYTKNQQMDLKWKKLYSPGYNLLFDIISIPSEVFFISINEVVDACGIPSRVLLLKKISQLLFVARTNNLRCCALKKR